jgi:osmotically-inducible protein OsmY
MKIKSHSLRNSIMAALAATALSTGAVAGSHEKSGNDWQGEMSDAWIDGKVETSFTLNRYLNPFEIDTDVQGGKVVLTGSVESQVDKDLAEEIVEGIEGVTEVDNRLTIEPNSRKSMDDMDDDSDRSFGQYVDDATITARVKYALLANDSTEGLSIDVDTHRGAVTLSGDVDSRQIAEVAERLAETEEGVRSVDNNLKVNEAVAKQSY